MDREAREAAPAASFLKWRSIHPDRLHTGVRPRGRRMGHLGHGNDWLIATCMHEPIDIAFPDGTIACAVHVEDIEDVPLAMKELGLSVPTRVLVLVGGAAGLSTVDVDLLRSLFVEVLAPLAEELIAV